MEKKDIKKVVLAYSGGLDTSIIIPWLKENYDYEVICCCIDCGQEEELDGLEERAKLSGASKLYIEDIVDEFCDEYIIPCVQAGAVYENKYLLGTSMARPVIAKRLVEIARKEGFTTILHWMKHEWDLVGDWHIKNTIKHTPVNSHHLSFEFESDCPTCFFHYRRDR